MPPSGTSAAGTPCLRSGPLTLVSPPPMGGESTSLTGADEGRFDRELESVDVDQGLPDAAVDPVVCSVEGGVPLGGVEQRRLAARQVELGELDRGDAALHLLDHQV